MVEPTLAQLNEVYILIEEVDTRTLDSLMTWHWQGDKKITTLDYWLMTAERTERFIEVLRDPARNRWK
jgi:hypothetical protein